MEAKNNMNKLEGIRRWLQFQGFHYVDPQGLSGGLALRGTSEVNLSILSSSKNMISASIFYSSINNPWLLSCVYADTFFNRRIDNWNELQSVGSKNLEAPGCALVTSMRSRQFGRNKVVVQ